MTVVVEKVDGSIGHLLLELTSLHADIVLRIAWIVRKMAILIARNV